MTRTLWIDPTFGASGDMLLGALAGLLEAQGGDPLAVLGALDELGLEEFSLDLADTVRNGLSAKHMGVQTPVGTQRNWSDIDSLLAGAGLPARVEAGARATFRALGEVEAAAHAVPIDQVHFHEVGAVDAIVDITGVWLLVDALGLDRVVVGPVGLGHGTVEASHGTLPLPAPATLTLLEGHPVRSLNIEGETCTPTGAALVVTMADAWGPIPSGTVAATSRGAGNWNPTSHPNVVTAAIVDTTKANGPGATDDGHQPMMLETNIDDVTAEVLAHVVGLLLDAGADDAWLVPIVMKKGRPAHELRVLCRADNIDDLRLVVERETGTLGTRSFPVTKNPQPRHFDTVLVRGEPITMKHGPHGAKPEFDEVAALAAKLGVPVRILLAEAQDPST